MKKHFFNLLTITLLLPGCAATALNHPDAAKVRITNVEPGKECKFLGDVTGNQGNFFTGAYTSNSNLETGARNDIKNQAATMGGNVVAIITQRAGQTMGGDGWGMGGAQTNVILSGNVYLCP